MHSFHVIENLIWGVEETSEAAKLVDAKHTIPYHMFSWKAFYEETANNFDDENKLIVRPDTEIEL